jgi:hypothetical protein
MVSAIIVYLTCMYFFECCKDIPFLTICYECLYLISIFWPILVLPVSDIQLNVDQNMLHDIDCKFFFVYSMRHEKNINILNFTYCRKLKISSTVSLILQLV